MKRDNNYVVYHLHSDLSNGVTNIDSITKYNEYVDYAASLGMKAMGFAEHGNVLEWTFKKAKIEAKGMKYIHAEEFYVTEKIWWNDENEINKYAESLLGCDEKEAQEKIYEYMLSTRKQKRDNYHCVLIAKNYDGVRELNKLSSIAFNREDGHYYYTPRITFKELINTSDNIIICTGCLASILASDNTFLKDQFISFLTQNKHRCFLEIQHHNVQKQKDYNIALWKLSQETNVPIITGTDTHALNEEHLKGRSILQKSKDIHFDDEDGWDLTFKTYEELLKAYEVQNALPMDVVKEAINNTNVLADMIEEFKMDKSYKYPKLVEDNEQYIRQKIAEGIKEKGIDKYPNYNEYLEQIEREMDAYKHNKALDFIILEQDYKSEVRKEDIHCGWSRGSVSGSIIAYILGITDVDSIKYDLNFDRFMNVERVSLADVDSDWFDNERYVVREHLFNDARLNCCNIITFNTIQLKGAIKDVGRALGYSVGEAQDIANSVYVDEESGKETVPDEVRNKHKELFKYVDIVVGTITSIGRHAAGLVVSTNDLEADFGTLSLSTDPRPVSQIYMKEIDALNYVKLDILGLDCVGLIENTCRDIGIPYLSPDTLNFNDEEVWKDIAKDTALVFQFESGFASDFLKQCLSEKTINNIKKYNPNFSYLDVMAMASGAIRPAGASYRDELSKGVFNDNGNKQLNNFLAPTLGYLVYQEQIIGFLNKFCGYTMGQADVVRRHFSKKTGTENDIPMIKEGFVHTMTTDYNISEEEAEHIITNFLVVIKDASDYLFSRNHSIPYSMLGYACAWLRHYYPLETLTEALNIYSGGNSDAAKQKLENIKEYIKSKNITINPIKFGKSRSKFFYDRSGNSIYQGVAAIKNLNGKVAEELYELSQNKRYNNFIDLLIDIKNTTSLQNDQLDILIKLDYFSDFGEVNELTYITSKFNILYDKNKGFKKSIKQAKLGLDPEFVIPYCEEYKAAEVKEVNINAIATAITDSDRQQKYREIVKQCEKHKKTGEFNGYNYEKLFKLTEMPEDVKQRFATKISEAEYKNIDAYKLLTNIKYMGKPFSVKQLVSAQQEFMSYIDYINPNLDPRYVVVTQLDTSYSPKFAAYCLKNGKTEVMKVRKTRSGKGSLVYTTFKEQPFENGDILYMKKCKKEPKAKMVDGEWTRDYMNKEWWLYDYDIKEGINIDT
ncbi:DNA polymerase-3 subunit alpha [Eubacterium ruminantium]|uniref:DNA-directed DNA polymerase n=1 Tax=Eubacterium ruminantium TaxID=42322 RepID=A0A1T4P112_9FIRM|nr:PHP domain-containing protein [Eubacterium ruminantium]SCW56796.1 DNA polymerase-3 subunit alpha [Eubacterium ruminantium]SDN07065.1 DNA polymerase-3 subunit alpha [Eubacterium ruminantium]SJZ84997.1 DNA polymerase-3 subunit alpha [Eubacterium ruminantium]